VLDVLVVGAGQAGLAMGYALSQQGRDFLVVDAADEIGQSWRSRWDSLVLFTPAQYDGLPGVPFPAATDTYPTKDDVADYLATYAERSALPVRLSAPVTDVSRQDGHYLATVDGETVEAKRVVIATGPFQAPFTPNMASDADASVVQLHSAVYRRPADLPTGPALVVGGANSGCQIARELAETRPVHLAVGDRVPALPQRFLGKDLWWWGNKVGLSSVTVESKVGGRLSRHDPVIGASPRALARRHGVRLHPRVSSIAGSTVTFADGTSVEPASMVWATGFRGAYQWIQVPGVLDNTGTPLHLRGVRPPTASTSSGSAGCGRVDRHCSAG
jgi:putative flavoprotein involved in K+ transport